MPVNNTRFDIQAAFQGGGARILELIAAADALKDIHLNDDYPNIKVKSVAGTSAGSIAAALFYTNADFVGIIDEHKNLDKSIRKNFPEWKIFLPFFMWQMCWNKPLFPKNKVENLIRDLFAAGNITNPEESIETFKGKQTDCDEIFILAANLKNQKTGLHDTNSSKGLMEALVDSAAIPFVFRTANGKTSDAHILDGGLFENLPFTAFSNEPSGHALPLAFTFAGNVEPRVKFSALGYAKFILGKLLDKAVNEAKLFYRDEAIINLPNTRDTLEFHKIFKGDFKNDYKDLKTAIAQDILKAITTPKIKEVNWHSSKTLDIVRKEKFVSEQASDFANHVQAGARYAISSLTVEAIGNSLNNPKEADIHRSTMIYLGSQNTGLQFLRSKFYCSKEGTLALPQLKFEVKPETGGKWNELPVMFLPLDSPEQNREILIVFPEPMKAGFKYRYTKTEKIFDSFKIYSDGKNDYVGFVFSSGKSVKNTNFKISFPDQATPNSIRDLTTEADKEILQDLFGSTTKFQIVQSKGKTSIVKRDSFTTYSLRFGEIKEDVANFLAVVYRK